MEKKKNLIIVGVVLGIVLLIGITYAFFMYYRESEKVNELIAGEIYMNYTEGDDIINLPNAFPETDEEARAREDNFITFTIDGKNTTTNKDVWYEIILTEADNIDGKTRFLDEHLKFDLIETVDGVSTMVVSGKTFDEINNTRIWVNTIPRNTTEEVSITYQLRMWLSDEILISDTAENASYTTDEFKNSYANVKVAVSGDFECKGLRLYDEVETSLAPYLLADDGDARIIRGTADQVTNNYVWYSGKLWRIVALNNDGSIKLVTDEHVTSINYGADTTYAGSWMYQWLNEDFLDTLYNYENLLVTDYQWNATGTTATTKPANTTMVEGTVGLLNAYEYVQSYGSSAATGYLYDGYKWRLLTPYNASSVRYVSRNGPSVYNAPGTNLNGVRPSINLKANIEKGCVKCDGSKTNPYRLVGDISIPTTNELLNERVSGEYVTFDNELYRIVSIENDIVKITKVDSIRDDSGVVVTKYFASTYLFGASGNTQSEDYWDYYLNNTWYNSISSTYKNMIVSGTWYLGTVGDNNSYKNAICATSNTTETTESCTKTSAVYNGYVGLGRIGEMFTNQIGEGHITSSSIYAITPFDTLNVRYVHSYGQSGKVDPLSFSLGARPSVNLASSVYVTSGLGTEESPFEIAM